MTQPVYAVSTLVNIVKSSLDHNLQLQNVLLAGEVSNLVKHRSGHWYFSLKDAQAKINCVMFSMRNRSVLFPVKDGDAVLLHVNVTVFVASGQLQCLVDRMDLQGSGDLYLKYEQLKKKLEQQGLFAASHKRALPVFPFSIGVITGAGSAALADIQKTLAQRWPVAAVQIYPSLVQGSGASEKIIECLQLADQNHHDVLILARGGGSIEDLWAFNDEALAHCIYQLHTPLVTGIGHEIDTTIADYVADVRAVTPTAAAQSATPVLREVCAKLSEDGRLRQLRLIKAYNQAVERYQDAVQRPKFSHPNRLLESYQLQLDYNNQRLINYKNTLQNYAQQIQNTVLELGQLCRQLQHRYKLTLRTQQLRLQHDIRQQQDRQTYHLQKLIQGLDFLSPLKIMSRGYALTFHEGKVIHGLDEIDLHEELTIQYKDGKIRSVVTQKEKNNE